MPSLFAETAMLSTGWANDVRIDIDVNGKISAVGVDAATAPDDERYAILIPGMPNVHCHAFQRAMTGLTQRAGPEGDDFWSWREIMYRFLGQLSPDQVEAIAGQLYVEMLKAGYTAVAEFHYLHHDPAGRPYLNRAEMAERIAKAAHESGIRLTLLPVLYQTGNFGGIPPTEGQRRFVMGSDQYRELVLDLHARHRDSPGFRIGVAPHSLRAVPPEALRSMQVWAGALRLPMHIHAAEQIREVEDCIAWSGMRPVEWLLEQMPLDERWTLIHCTHMREDEARRLAACGAVAGLCPTTEADLGDGVFPFVEYSRAHGRFAVGSDSNVGTSPAEELRWLEYAQRLQRRRRNLSSATPGESIGGKLWRMALAGGAQALAQPVGAIAPGKRADLLVLDPAHPSLAGRNDDQLLDSLIFGGGSAAIRHVMVDGRWVVREGHHGRELEIADAYRHAVGAIE